ncbi:ankyrin repeat domain-containing protein 50 [Microdochium nivale]|nr:ankyrin repeat domain-containing protein 50 [Microdochium nivale]
MPKMLAENHDRDSITRLFHDHKELLRQLYQGQDGKSKTLKQIKEIMEGIHGFPKIPLPQYEVRLKNELGLRKKLGRNDWSAVWDNYRALKERLGVPVAVYLNCTEIPWSKVWKEIRRNCNWKAAAPAHPRQLPPGITIMPRSHVTSVQPGLSAEMDCNTVVSQVSPWTTPASPNGAIPLRNEANQQTQPLTVGSTAEVAKISPLLACNFDDSLSPERFMRSWREGNVRNLPWIQFMSSISALFSDPSSTPGLRDVLFRNQENIAPSNIAFRHLVSNLEILSLSDMVFESALFRIHNENLSSQHALALEFDPIYILAKAVLRFCNTKPSHDHPSLEDRLLYTIIFQRIVKTSHRLVLAFIGGDLPSIIVTCRRLINLAIALDDKINFVLLMKANAGRFQTMLGFEYPAIEGAATFGCLTILERVLSRSSCVKPNYCLYSDAIRVAVRNGHFSCAASIIDTSSTHSAKRDNHILFQLFIGDTSYDVRKPVFLPTLNYFLDKGADVHAACHLTHPLESAYANTNVSNFRRASALPPSWQVSLLEQAYYQKTPVYEAMVPYRKNGPMRLQRDRICLAAKIGSAELERYLQSVPVDKDQQERFLQLVLVEQFFLPYGGVPGSTADPDFDWNVVTVLSERVDPNLALLQVEGMDESLLLHRAVMCLSYFGVNDRAVQFIARLIQHGAIFHCSTIAAAVSTDGTEVLSLIRDFGADVRHLGGRALASAARKDNYDAVTWLLDAGVDIRAIIRHRKTGVGQALTVLGASTGRRRAHTDEHGYLGRWTYCQNEYYSCPSPKMIRHLASKGAPLQYSADDMDSIALLQRCWVISGIKYHSARLATRKAQFEYLQVFLDHGLEPCQSEATRFLERSAKFENWTAFELLLDRGAPLSPGSPLAALIKYKAPAALTTRVLNASPDLNGRTRNGTGKSPASAAARIWDVAMLENLSARGASFDLPHLGPALFQACRANALNAQEAEAQLDTVRYILDQTDSTLMHESLHSSFTDALRASIGHGSLELVLVLLDKGVPCNCNDARVPMSSNLDVAARAGYLDITQLLLNNGAVSHRKDSTPFDGAIDGALKGYNGQNHVEVARLIARFAVSLDLTLEEDHRWLCSS